MGSIAAAAQGSSLILDVEDFREKAHRMVDFIADYYKDISSFPVQSQVSPGYLKKLLPTSAPQSPESLEEILADVRNKIIPGVTHWMSPSFFGYFAASGSTAGILGDMLSNGFNIVGFNWLASPAASELEVITLDWLAKLLNLPPCFMHGGSSGGITQGTASEALLLALLAARTKTMTENGVNDLSKLTLYCSDQMHSSFQKACVVAGIPPSNVVIIPTHRANEYALSPSDVRAALEDTILAGFIPCFLGATMGTTSSGAIDPLLELGSIAEEYGVWYHIDAAYGGNAYICPEYMQYLDGVEKADSFNVNLHKWLLTNFGCSAIWFKDTTHLVKTLSTKPEYLATKVEQNGHAVDFKDWEIPLGRSFRSLRLWFVMRLYGASQLRDFVENHIDIARLFEKLVRKDKRFEVFVPRKFALVCFRMRPLQAEDDGNEMNSKLLETINSKGDMFLTHAVLSGVYVLRMAIGGTLTDWDHVSAAWKTIQQEAEHIILGS